MPSWVVIVRLGASFDAGLRSFTLQREETRFELPDVVPCSGGGGAQRSICTAPVSAGMKILQARVEDFKKATQKVYRSGKTAPQLRLRLFQ
jgi:hypothetical protein